MKIDLDHGDKIYVKSFPGATSDCMQDYVKPTLRYNAGTNDLKFEKTNRKLSY